MLQNIDALVRGRRSVRTFEERTVSRETLEELCACWPEMGNPYGLPLEFRLLDAKEHALSCPVVVGTDLYVGAKMRREPNFNEAFGYSFELLVLQAQALGLGTVWVGGTMDRAGFERAMALDGDEVMPCVSPLGYPAQKMSLRETLMRKGIKADERMAFEELFFDGSFAVPLTREKAGALAWPLEMVRLAPSAVNKQPWRVVLEDGAAHFFLRRAKGFAGSSLDMQKIDLGIALCHFDVAAKEKGFAASLVQEIPAVDLPENTEYIASFVF